MVVHGERGKLLTDNPSQVRPLRRIHSGGSRNTDRAVVELFMDGGHSKQEMCSLQTIPHLPTFTWRGKIPVE